MIFYKEFCLTLFVIYFNCVFAKFYGNVSNNQKLPKFRNTVEEINEYGSQEQLPETQDETNKNIVKFMVDNVKEIFIDEEKVDSTPVIVIKRKVSDVPKPWIKILMRNMDSLSTLEYSTDSTEYVTPSLPNVTVNVFPKDYFSSYTIQDNTGYKFMVTYTKPTVKVNFLMDNEAEGDGDEDGDGDKTVELTPDNTVQIQNMLDGPMEVNFESPVEDPVDNAIENSENDPSNSLSVNPSESATSYIESISDRPIMEIPLKGIEKVKLPTSEMGSGTVELRYTDRRSCIKCNNIDNESCGQPVNTLVPSTVCPNHDDLCYSLHTPFGIVERGCYNVDSNLTIFVCSCNLCNYIAIAEMPYIFTTKAEWVENVIDLTRTRSFRKSVFKKMSCLKCEVSASDRDSDMVKYENCVEGNIPYLPAEICGDNEICGIRAIRKLGYIWRGCVNVPLYNYWWAFCDRDLCNYDPVLSIYD